MSNKIEFMSYEEAQELMQAEGIKSSAQLSQWCKSEKKPNNFPCTPRSVYKDKWQSMGHFLNTGVVASQNMDFMSFDDARKLMKTEGIKSLDQFYKWKKEKRPNNFPSSPYQKYKNEWQSWGHFLDTGAIATANMVFMSYVEAQDLMQKEGIKSWNQFKQWCKGKRPNNFPGNPAKVYKNEWISVGHFLNTGTIAPSNMVFMSYAEAQKLIQTEGIKSGAQFKQWCKEKRPRNCPSNPEKAYKSEWKGWGEFLGTDNVHNKEFMSYDEAQEIMQKEGIKSRTQFKQWCNEKRPNNFPWSLENAYKNKWKSWGEFLGTGTIAPYNIVFMTYVEAQELMQKEGIKTWNQFDQWRKEKRPDNFPWSPENAYKNEWMGFGHFLNTINIWNKANVLTFAKTLSQPGVIESLSPSELYMIIQKGGFLKAIEKLDESNPLRKHIFDKLHGKSSSLTNDELRNLESLISNIDIDSLDTDDSNDNSFESDDIQYESVLPSLQSHKLIETVDVTIDMVNLMSSADEDTVNFILSKRKGLIWSNILNIQDENQLENEIVQIINCPDGEFANKLKNEFLNEYNCAKNLKIPEGYSYPYAPSLMQKLVAYKLTVQNRLGNWSGQGSGKTLGAILSSRVIGAQNTIVIGLNSTMLNFESGWAKEIKIVFPDTNVTINRTHDIILDENNPNFLLYNYEKFQQYNTNILLDNILQHKIDMIVIDEIHFAKNTDDQDESKRRLALLNLIHKAHQNNPELRVLGMSATPVINDLHEAVSLMQMITSNDYEIDTTRSISNALVIHEHLVNLGVRFKPTYACMHLETKKIQIDAPTQFAHELSQEPNKILSLEQKITELKLPTIISEIKKGTIIYSHYITGIKTLLKNELVKNGFTCGIFDGTDKTGLEMFKDKKIDVLIASSSIATGVDELQNVCNKMIIVTLPWTSAAYEQLVARIYRQGSNFKNIEIVIPQVVLNSHDGVWSWDQQRMDRIENKKTLADVAVDGVIPNGKEISQAKLLKLSKDSLAKWINRLEEGDIIESNATPFVPDELPEVTREYILSKFSEMNKNMNTSKSETVNNKFNENPDEFYEYHRLYEQASSDWGEMPYIKIANDINKLDSNLIIADLGCGINKLKDIVPNKVYAFDHISVDSSIACDIKKVPLDDNSVDVAVFSLSLMGTNWVDYIEEASRILKSDSYILIAEPHERSQKNKDMIIETLSKFGFNMLPQYPKTSDDGRFDYWYAHKSPL